MIKVFVVHISTLAAKITIYFAKKAQIFIVLVEKVNIPVKYLNFIDKFSKNSAKVFFKYTRSNKPVIEFE